MNFTETLQLMLAQVGDDFYGPDSQAALEHLSHLLPPIERGGFECRLVPTRADVDFQQCILPGEIAGVLAHLQGQISPTSPDYPQWARLFAFLGWAQSNPQVLEIWMEYDTVSIQQERTTLPLPSVFVGFTQAPANQQEETVAALDLLVGREGWQSWRPVLERCFDACRGEQFVSHVGAMLARQGAGCRVNVKRLTPANLAVYLDAIGWAGGCLPQWLTGLLEEFDRITLALDVSHSLSTGVGFECILKDPSRWPNGLAALRRWGWLSARQVAHMQRWAGVTTPASHGHAYPQHHLLAALWRDENEFSRFVQKISQVKLSYHPNQPIQSKGYLWFHHEWERVSDRTNGERVE